MRPNPLASLWERLDTDPPLFTSDDLARELVGLQSQILQIGLLQETSGSRSALCPNCAENHIGSVEVLSDPRKGRVQNYVVCPECGAVPIDSERLRRWEANIPNLLKAVMEAADGEDSVVELIASHLWHMGSATWGGRRREAYFVRCVHDSCRPAIITRLASHPRAVLFFPTESSLRTWRGMTPNPVAALESVLLLAPDRFLFNPAPIETCLADQGLFNTTKPKTARKRAVRAANIERLKLEVIEHIRAAKANALTLLSLDRPPELLQRPSQQELARRCGLEEYDVTRCFQDETAQELNFYWETAQHLDLVMNFHGPVGRGKST